MLLNSEADFSAIDKRGNTPLHTAAQNGRKSVMDILINYGANIATKNKSGKTPLQIYQGYSKDRDSITKHASREKKKREDNVKFFLKQCQKDGTVDILPVKCVLTGLPRVGKTSFLKRVQQKMNSRTVHHNKEEVIPSTGFEAPITVNIAEEATTISTATINKGHWVVTDDLHEQGNILMSSLRPQNDNLAQQRDITQPDNKTPSPQRSAPVSLTESLPPPSTSILKSTSRIIVSDFKSAKMMMEDAVWQRPAKEFEDGGTPTQLSFIDTGGQIEFQELLPPLLHGPAIHLIFFNAFSSLFKAVEVEYRHPDSNISSVKYETSSSSIEIIQQLLVSFYGISQKDNSKSVACLFSSYIDQFSSNPDERAQQLKEVSDSLRKQFCDTSFYKNNYLAQPIKEECPYIFQPLDNIGCPEDELEKAQQFILSVVKESFTPVSLPVKWATFHLALRNEYEKSPGVCTMEQCSRLADDCRIPAEHLPFVLEFFHFTLGTILYYKDIISLKDFVIVNPNILFSGISKLVALYFIGSGERYGTTQSIRQTGEVSKSNLQLNEPLSENCPLTSQHLVDLLAHYKLLVSKESTYLMPCLLLPDKEVVSSLVSLDVLSLSTPPLLILFEEGFVPIGLFSGMVNVLSERWDLDESNRFRNRVKFTTPPGYVEIRQCLKYIEIRAERMSSYYKKIQEEAMKCIESVISVQPHIKETKYLIGFYCPGSLSTHLHVCRYSCSFDKALVCTNDPKCFDSKPLSPKHHLWFDEQITPTAGRNTVSLGSSHDHSGSSVSPIKNTVEEHIIVEEVNDVILPDLALVDNSLLAEDVILDVLCECYDIVEWKLLGGKLGITEANLSRINVDETSEVLRLKTVLSEWLSSGSASWRGLVDALLYPPLKAVTIAKAIANKHPVEHYNLHGSQIVGENRFLLKGNSPQSLDWSDYGFKMYFPQDTLPPHDTCEVAVLALIGGNFQIPEGTELVSAIFSVSFAKEVNQPVQVEIEHCVELTSQNDADEMIFVATDTSGGEVFKAVNEAKFPPNNRYGITDQLHFSNRFMAILRRIFRRPAPLPIKYFGCLFYQTVKLNQWTVEFFVIKAIKAHEQHFKSILKTVEELSTIEFQFKNEYLELILSAETVPPSGWRLDPLTKPLRLMKSQVDEYTVSSPHRVSSRITVYCSTEAAEPLHYPIQLEGIECEIKEIYINLDIGSSHSHSRSSVSATDDSQSLVAIVKDVFRQNVDKLSQVLHLSVSDFARKMYQDNLITEPTAENPSYSGIIKEALASLEFLRHKHEIEERCSKILGVLTRVGGPCVDASQAIKQQLKDETSKKLNIELNI